MLVIINRIITIWYFQEYLPIIGRWTVDYNIDRINRKVYLSNEDHCGTCTSPTEISFDTNIKNTKSIYIHKSFKYNLTNH